MEARDPLDNIRRAELKRIFRHRGVSEVEVHNAVEDIISERRRWTAAELGLRMKLPFTEWEKLGIRTMRCIDRSPEMMRLYVAERRLERDRIRKGKKRAMNVKTKGLSPRAKELAAMLNSDWQQSCDLVELIRKRRGRNQTPDDRASGPPGLARTLRSRHCRAEDRSEPPRRPSAVSALERINIVSSV